MKYIKGTIIGDGGVGKSTLINRFWKYDDPNYEFDTSYNATTQSIITANKFDTNIGKISMSMADIPGQDGYNDTLSSYLLGSLFVIIMYDCTNRNSAKNIDTWLKKIKFYLDAKNTLTSLPIYIIGNKIDKINKSSASATTHLRKSHIRSICGGYYSDITFVEMSVLENTIVIEQNYPYSNIVSKIRGCETLIEHIMTKLKGSYFYNVKINKSTKTKQINPDKNSGPNKKPRL